MGMMRDSLVPLSFRSRSASVGPLLGLCAASVGLVYGNMQGNGFS